MFPLKKFKIIFGNPEIARKSKGFIVLKVFIFLKNGIFL